MGEPDAQDLLRLADEVMAAKKSDNALDVRCEIALFEPNSAETAIRANSAGTKVIVWSRGLGDRTYRAGDYTLSASARQSTADRLRARAHSTKESNHG